MERGCYTDRAYADILQKMSHALTEICSMSGHYTVDTVHFAALQGDIVCYNCNKTGHIAAQCSKQGGGRHVDRRSDDFNGRGDDGRDFGSRGRGRGGKSRGRGKGGRGNGRGNKVPRANVSFAALKNQILQKGGVSVADFAALARKPKGKGKSKSKQHSSDDDEENP